ncbi:dihydrofolate reductase [Algoriella xinjiangensis]|uniref:Dihydrofolate reductase n=1 Tax=Algoriella xinjiangensis TaxID=684065 RepID=A0A1I4UW42_9FLAO|nr:dihydrofolate reductase [Algoriella xinjiangensis]SFM93146.1 dihydrofolate reductase [Algoriella xinjiangensis]VDH18134.1 Dihydrofolate reductase [Algoriella xinjiangensis]
MINVIVAKASNNVIGAKNDLIWHLPNDLKHFKNLTSGHPIIMGRKTFESLGRPLPNRTNIVVTRDKDWQAENIEKEFSLEKAIESAKKINEDIYIIGGGNIYKQAMEFADVLYITEVHHEFEGDTYFPEIDEEIWEEVARENFMKDEKHPYAYSYVTYKRIED